MNIKIKKIEIHNFLSYKDESFDFEKTRGMNLITGKNLDIPGSKNGAGKSSLVLALTYGIFGELPFELKNGNIPNRFLDDKETRVCVYLDSERKHYKICSGLRGRASNCSLFEIANGKEKDITKSTIAETRNYIQKEILNCDLPLFMRTIFLNSDPSYNFYNLSKKDRKEFIDKLFDISMYGEMFVAVHRDNLQLEKDISDHQNRLVELNRNSEEYIRRSEEHIRNVKDGIERIRVDLSEKERELSSKRSRTVERNTEEIGRLTSIRESLSESLSKMRMTAQKKNFDITTLKGSVSSYESKIKDREKLISKCDTIRNKLCPDCKKIFSKHYRLETYVSEIEKFEKEIAKARDGIASETEAYVTISSEIKGIEKEMTEISAKISDLNSSYESHSREISEIEREVSGLKFKMENLEHSENPYVPLIESNNSRIEDENASMEGIKRRYRSTKFLEDIVSQENLKKYIINDLVGILNAKIRHYLHRLGANYDIVFDENMEYAFETQDRSGAQFHNFSSGEQARISIATCFAFRDFLSMRNSISSNILVLDEFIDSNVDSQCIENIVDILKEFSGTSKQNIYLVSHRQEVDPENFNRIIQIEKKDNVSTIRYLKS